MYEKAIEECLDERIWRPEQLAHVLFKPEDRGRSAVSTHKAEATLGGRRADRWDDAASGKGQGTGCMFSILQRTAFLIACGGALSMQLGRW